MTFSTILSVDDDPVMLKIIQFIFRKKGLSELLHSFQSGKDCLAYLDDQTCKENRYLLLLDLNMPGMSGFELLDILSSKPYNHAVSVVILTSSIAQSDRDKARCYSNVTDYIEKPLRPDHLDRLLAPDRSRHVEASNPVFINPHL